MNRRSIPRDPATMDQGNTSMTSANDEVRNDDLALNQLGPNAEVNLPATGYGARPTPAHAEPSLPPAGHGPDTCRTASESTQSRGLGQGLNSTLHPPHCPHTDLHEGQVHRTGSLIGNSASYGRNRPRGLGGNGLGRGDQDDSIMRLLRQLARLQEQREKKPDDLEFFGDLIERIKFTHDEVLELKRVPSISSCKAPSPLPSTSAPRLPQIQIPIRERRSDTAGPSHDAPPQDIELDIEHFLDPNASPALPSDNTPLLDQDSYLIPVMHHYLSCIQCESIPTEDLKVLKELAKDFRDKTEERLYSILAKQLLTGFNDVPRVRLPENELGLMLNELVRSILRDLFSTLEHSLS